MKVLNWTGTTALDTGSSTNDRLLFQTNPGFTAADLANFQFSNDSGVNYVSGAVLINYNGYYELVPPNSAPTASASPNPATTNEDTAVTITLNGTDADDNALTFSITQQPTHGTLSAISAPNCTAVNTCTATVTYTPSTNYFGADSFKFKANDGMLDSAAATVSLTVNAVNHAPVASASPNPATTNEDTPVTIALTGTDVDGNSLTFAVTAQPTHGTLSAVSAPNCSAVNTCMATVTYTPAAYYHGADSFKFKANDGTLDSAVVTVSLTVNAVNHAPVASASPNPA
ncbi:MAG: cadherin-like domain-containing protein, partial [Actinomycetota bacterium]|nr:cadherin-like domain-containing protein [Actinomycetota bacterium]